MQYTSVEFQHWLERYGMRSSMSRKGNCYDNAVAESFFHTLKTELVGPTRYHSQAKARLAFFEYITVFYNHRRRHSFLNYMTPAQFEAAYDKEA